MTTVKNNGSIRTTWFGGTLYFVSFMGRYACGGRRLADMNP